MQIYQDQVGAHRDLSAYASAAYKLDLMLGVLSVGMQAGFTSLSTDYSTLSLQNQADPNFVNPPSKTTPNFGLGAFFSNELFYAGISVPYILNNEVYDQGPELTALASTQKRYYFITGGMVFPLSTGFKLRPSTLLRYQEGAPLGMDINCNVFIDDVVNLGASWRSGDAMIFLFEVRLNQWFSVGYAYDYPVSSIRTVTSGSHEFMLSYRLQIGQKPCHTYF